MAKAFKLKVEELSGGSVTIDLMGSGVLGSESTILDGMMSGGNVCDLSRISASSLVAYGCEEAKLLTLPYTFSNTDHFMSFASSDLAQTFLNEPQEIGLPLRSLCYGLDGFRHFFFTRSVNDLDDLNGLHIRVAMDALMTGMVSDLGARATPMAFAELYAAMQTGVVDGAEQPAANYYSNAFYEVAPYLLLDGHTVGVSQIVISDNGWDKLSAQQQAWVQEAADYASGVCCQRAIEAEQSALQQLSQKGVTITEVADKEPWRVKCQPTISANVGDNSGLYQQIVDLQFDHIHSYTEWEEITSLTCTQDGKYTRKCTECGYTQWKTIKASHSFSDWAETSRTSTHIFYSRTCSICGITETKNELIPVENQITLTYAEVNPIDGTVAGDMAKAFKLRVEELSGGSMTIDLMGSGVLGSESSILDSMISGNNVCDLSRVSASSLAVYGCEEAKLLSLPYTFSNADHFMSFISSDLAQTFLNEPQEIGLPLRGLCYGLDGFRHFFFTRSVKGLDDLNGLHIRVAMDNLMTGMVSDLGARATPMAFAELYAAMQTGVVDGAEQPAANYYSNAFYEVAPYLLLDGHTVGVSQIVISDNGWDKLSAQQQAWVQEAADYASGVCCQRAIEAEQSALQQLSQKGVTITEVADKEPWRAKCQPTISANVGTIGSLYRQILDMQ